MADAGRFGGGVNDSHNCKDLDLNPKLSESDDISCFAVSYWDILLHGMAIQNSYTNTVQSLSSGCFVLRHQISSQW